MRCLSDDVDEKYLVFIKKSRSQTKEKNEEGGGDDERFFPLRFLCFICIIED